jgi:hypothetical protein
LGLHEVVLSSFRLRRAPGAMSPVTSCIVFLRLLDSILVQRPGVSHR